MSSKNSKKQAKSPKPDVSVVPKGGRVFVFYTPCEQEADEASNMACEAWDRDHGHHWCRGRGWHDSW